MNGIAHVVSDREIRTIAIVGCSKNSGKTTAMNHVLYGLKDAVDRIGLMSIGIDGEEADFWLGVPKPRVIVREGFLVATADKAIKSGTAQVRTIAKTGAVTPLGELVLVRVEREGMLVLAGVRHKADVRLLVDMMLKHQAQKVIIDGSYQRLMAADPEVSDGVILATGAILGRTIREVAKRTRQVLDRLLVSQIDSEDDMALLSDARRYRRPAIRESRGHIVILPEAVAASDDAMLREALGKGDVTIAIPGVVTDRLMRTLLQQKGGRITLLIPDATRLFISAPLFNRFRERGGEVKTGRGIRLLAIAVNPVSVLGYELPEDALLAAIQAITPGVPVFSFKGGEL